MNVIAGHEHHTAMTYVSMPVRAFLDSDQTLADAAVETHPDLFPTIKEKPDENILS